MTRSKNSTNRQNRSARSGSLDIRLDEADRPGSTAPKKAKPKSRPQSKPQSKTGKKASAGSSQRRKRKDTSSKQRQSRSKRRGGFLWRATKFSVYWSTVLGIWGLIAVAGIVAFYAVQLPQTSDWKVPDRPPNVRIVSASGELIANRGETGGQAVRLNQMPPYLPEAVIAIEDRRFYSHFGFDAIGFARAMMVNLTSGRLVQGGSTLTQQLAKNLFLTHERSFRRKVQELVLAFWLEANYSKDEILELYLNRVYFGAGAYGVDAAANRYFDKSVRTITLSEAAVIAGLLKAPSRFAPTRAPELAERRAKVVLGAMEREGFITSEERRIAFLRPLTQLTRHRRGSQNYAADWVIEQLPDFVGKLTGDVIVETTLDMHLQRIGEDALKETLDKHGAAYKVSQGALVSMDATGAIKALVGGRDYATSQFNRAVLGRRQPGSAFKPFVYLAAIERGLTADTVRIDGPVSIRGWQPQNYSKDYRGRVSLQTALALSLNTVAAKLADEVGPKTVVDVAQRLGIQSKLKANPSLALGTSEVTPLELTGAYVPLANGGYGVIPHIIRRIRTSDGQILYERSGSGPGRVISQRSVAEMNLMMRETLLRGTGRKAALKNWQAGGKTGTSQNFRDAWFVGYTANLVTSVWLGNDNNSPTKKASGGNLPVEVWNTFMTAAHRDTIEIALPGLRSDALQTAQKPWRNPDLEPLDGHRGRDRALQPQGGDGGAIGNFLRGLFGG
ncbi:transglycosylase domain-containing protein [Coralliovum pocilloporae]|uniref:transglycosylase domain-containing protein n=1 Tax=Coralliovum pocilloporae TaxID=3066369 RepID=UPI0033077B71